MLTRVSKSQQEGYENPGCLISMQERKTGLIPLSMSELFCTILPLVTACDSEPKQAGGWWIVAGWLCRGMGARFTLAIPYMG